jgi:hypothetical protein
MRAFEPIISQGPLDALRSMAPGLATVRPGQLLGWGAGGLPTMNGNWGLVQTRVTLGGVKPSTTWPESLAPTSVTDGLARPFIEDSVTLAPCDLNPGQKN